MSENLAIVDKYTPQVSVIGGIILFPELMGEAMQQLTDDDFSAKNCLVVWRVMQRLFREGKPIDLVLLKTELAGFDGTHDFLLDAMEAAPNKHAFPSHVEAMKRIHAMERFKELAEQLNDAQTLEDQLEIAGKITAITAQRQARERRGMGGMLSSFGTRHASGTATNFLPWPVSCLNDGLPVNNGRYGIIGGYPSDGKTAMMLEAGVSQARKGHRVGIYSLETNNDDLEDRLVSSLAGIDFNKIQYNRLSSGDWERYTMACSNSELPLEAIQAAGMTVDDIRADALAHRYDVIYVDYLQLVKSRFRSRAARWEEVSDISQELQQLAKTTGMVVVALSQMSRPNEDKKGFIQAPTMSDLRESGQIEQDADFILLLYRLDRRNIRAQRYLDIAKNKMGVTGHFTLNFEGNIQHFTDGHELTAPKPSLNRRIRDAVNAPAPVEQMNFAEINGDDYQLPF